MGGQTAGAVHDRAAMRYRVHHVTTYAYGERVDLATHRLHLTPRVLPHQRVIATGIAAEPLPARRTEDADHFGNTTTRLFLDQPHQRFQVTLEAMVDVEFPPPPTSSPPWEQAVAAREEAAEFAFDSPLAPGATAAGAYAAPSFAPGRPSFEVVRDLTRRIRQDFRFVPGVTDVTTPVEQVLKLRAGVCQDFTHVMIAGLRAHGIPARYVSGYIRTRPKPGEARRRGADQSHAWVSAWLGRRAGWVDFDPTNDLVVADEHVVLAWGRDFADVSPVRGVILGGGAHSVTVEVDLEPA
jgi:transglutaminase-like putative cysteine protease